MTETPFASDRVTSIRATQHVVARGSCGRHGAETSGDARDVLSFTLSHFSLVHRIYDVGALCETQSETFRCPLRALAGRFALHALTLYIPRRGVPRNAHFGPVIFTRSRRTHCARVHCTSPPRVIFLYTSPPAVSSTRSCLRLLRDFAQRAGSITPLRLEVLCRCSTHTHARRRRLPRCRFVPPRPNRHLLCGAAAAPSSPQSNISTLASFASRRHFLDRPRLGPPRVSSGSLPSTPFRRWPAAVTG